jgi:hypothetical protein
MIRLNPAKAARLMVASYHLLMGPAMTEREHTKYAILKAQVEKSRALAQAQVWGYLRY